MKIQSPLTHLNITRKKRTPVTWRNAHFQQEARSDNAWSIISTPPTHHDCVIYRRRNSSAHCRFWPTADGMPAVLCCTNHVQGYQKGPLTDTVTYIRKLPMGGPDSVHRTKNESPGRRHTRFYSTPPHKCRSRTRNYVTTASFYVHSNHLLPAIPLFDTTWHELLMGKLNRDRQPLPPTSNRAT
jgi:hypothetical protein